MNSQINARQTLPRYYSNYLHAPDPIGYGYRPVSGQFRRPKYTCPGHKTRQHMKTTKKLYRAITYPNPMQNPPHTLFNLPTRPYPYWIGLQAPIGPISLTKCPCPGHKNRQPSEKIKKNFIESCKTLKNTDTTHPHTLPNLTTPPFPKQQPKKQQKKPKKQTYQSKQQMYKTQKQRQQPKNNGSSPNSTGKSLSPTHPTKNKRHCVTTSSFPRLQDQFPHAQDKKNIIFTTLKPDKSF